MHVENFILRFITSKQGISITMSNDTKDNINKIIISETENSVTIRKIFDLAQTLDCGQAFRWEENQDGLWSGVAFGKNLTLSADDNSVTFHCGKSEFEEIWYDYFDLSADYDKIRERLSLISPVLKEAADYAPGIRILKQDPWEAICSFIISQNNNIPRIKGIIARLCENFGERIDGTNLFSFPSAEKIVSLSEEDLAVIRSGFRAKYILAGANAALEDGFLESMYSLPIDEARKKIQTVKGIGPKVADCALLYGFHRTECFPVDVWMKKAMAKLLPGVDPSIFGYDAGIAQQYIFHYSRMHPELF